MVPWWVADDQWCLRQPGIVWQEGQTWCTLCKCPAPKNHIIGRKHRSALHYTEQQQAASSSDAPAPALPAPASSSDALAPALPAPSSSAAPAPVLPAPASSSADPAPALPAPAASASSSAEPAPALDPIDLLGLPSDAEMHFDRGYGKGK